MIKQLKIGVLYMKNVLEDLWNGDICPSEKPYTETMSLKILIDNIHKQKQKLLEALDEKQRKLLDMYIELESDLIEQSSKEAFINGFKLGSDMMIEVLK